jgi:hypothetical protein
LPIWAQRNNSRNRQSAIGNRKSKGSLGLFVIGVLATAPTEFRELKAIGGGLLVLCRDVVAVLAVRALKHNVIACHKVISNCRLPIADLPCQ